MVSFNSNELFLVTGASSGLGYSIAQRIIELGGSVIAVGRNLRRLEEIKAELSAPDNFFIEVKDLCQDINKLNIWVGDLVKKYGSLSGFVHSAGVQETLPIQAINIDNTKKVFDTNIFSALSIIKGFSKKSNNIGSGASIVLISSIASEISLMGTASYSASKGAVNSTVIALSSELAKCGIRINAILPGHIETALFSTSDNALNKDFFERISCKYPLGIGKPLDVANLACFLLSNNAGWITGQNITIDGGATTAF